MPRRRNPAKLPAANPPEPRRSPARQTDPAARRLYPTHSYNSLGSVLTADIPSESAHALVRRIHCAKALTPSADQAASGRCCHSQEAAHGLPSAGPMRNLLLVFCRSARRQPGDNCAGKDPALNQFAEDGLELDVGVAGDARRIGARGKLGVGSGIDLDLPVRRSRRGSAHESVTVSRRAADPYLRGRLAGTDLTGDGGEIERVAAARVVAGGSHRPEDVKIIFARIYICNTDCQRHFPSLPYTLRKAVIPRSPPWADDQKSAFFRSASCEQTLQSHTPTRSAR